jgi:H/ACA ribonucleoprotein complex subunit 3
MTKSLLKKCLKCNFYTIRNVCAKCGKETVTAHPPRFSPDDKYVLLRSEEPYKKKRTSTVTHS